LLLLAIALVPPQTRAADDARWVTGITEAVHDASISSPVIGIVRTRPLPEGARVKQGDMLMELDNRIEEIDLTRKRLVRDHAKADLERARSLAAKSTVSITQEELDRKQAEFDVASSDHDLALEQLRRRQITAPFAGVVAEYHLKVGDGCQALQPLVRLVDPSRCHLIVSVDARIGHYLKTGESVQLEIEAGRDMVPVQGAIEFVSPVADPASGVMKVKVAFGNPDGRVRPGVSGRMMLPTQPDGK
jgi:RND family efflux transporter MFP subunit